VWKNKALDLLDEEFGVSFSAADIGNYVRRHGRPGFIKFSPSRL
jgi:hypothetical protein